MKVLRIIAAGVIAASILGIGSMGLAGASHKNPVTFTAPNAGLGFKAQCDVNGHVQLAGFFVNTTPFQFQSTSAKIVVDGTTTYNVTSTQNWATPNSSSNSTFDATALGTVTSFTTASLRFTGFPVFGDYRQDLPAFSC